MKSVFRATSTIHSFITLESKWCAPEQSKHSSLFCFIDSCVSIPVLTLTCLPLKFTHVLSANVRFISVVSMVTAPYSTCSRHAEMLVFASSPLPLYLWALWALLRFGSRTASIHITRLVCQLRCLPLSRRPNWMIFQFHLFTIGCCNSTEDWVFFSWVELCVQLATKVALVRPGADQWDKQDVWTGCCRF